MKKLFLTSFFFLSLNATSCQNNKCAPVYDFPDQTDYDVRATVLSAKGISIDSSGLKISSKLVDRLTDEVETCLIKQFGNPPTIPSNTQIEGQCKDNTFQLPIKRECLTVKVANDWILSRDGTQQMLPYIAGYGDCGKGLPTDGPCYWRAGIQDDLTIVVPPSFYLYKDPLVKITTGCRNPWLSSQLSDCMSPTTDPLGNGNEDGEIKSNISRGNNN